MIRRRLSLVSLFESNTLARMARLIDGQAAAPCARTRIIAPVQPRGTLPPMFCMGAGPLFHAFAEALAPRCPFLSVATPQLPQRAGIDTMEALAARVMPAILESHPSGPLLVAGWSLAGVLAVEVARQLEQAGRGVPAVILFDTVSPVRRREWFAPAPRRRQWELNLVKARYHLEDALTRGPKGVPGHLLRKLRHARERARYDRVVARIRRGRERAARGAARFRESIRLRTWSVDISRMRAIFEYSRMILTGSIFDL